VPGCGYVKWGECLIFGCCVQYFNQMRTRQFLILVFITVFISCDRKVKSDNQLVTTVDSIQEKNSIINYFNEIYQKEKLIKADDRQMLSITDSLFTKDSDKGLFYFIVFTKSLNGSDGFYSEGAGQSAFNYITNNPRQFAEYFKTSEKLNQKDLDNWADSISGEIIISNENNELKAVNDLETNLTEKMKGEKIEYKEIIVELLKRVKSTAHNKS
jgi:hypothetical protein